jgi:hypothetical protein
VASTGDDRGYRVVRRSLIGCTSRPIFPCARVGEGREGGGYPAVGCWESFWESSPPKGVGALGCQEHFFAQRNQFLHLSPTSIFTISPIPCGSRSITFLSGGFFHFLSSRTSCPVFACPDGGALFHFCLAAGRRKATFALSRGRIQLGLRSFPCPAGFTFLFYVSLPLKPGNPRRTGLFFLSQAPLAPESEIAN